MGVSCKIYIQKPREGVHRAGQPVTGILSYAIDEPTEYQSAILSLTGTAKCHWSESNGKSRSTYTGNQTFMHLELSILNKRPEERLTLPVGAYEFRFQFTLPFEIPSSFKDKHSNIEYKLRAKFERSSFFSLARKFDKLITVYGNVNPTTAMEPLTFNLHKVLFKLFASKEHVIDLKAVIQKSFLMPGENAHLQITVSNDTDKVISVKMELVSKTLYHSTGFFSSKTKMVESTIYGCNGISSNILENSVSQFSCLVPTRPDLYSIQHCEIISKEFFVRVTVVIDFPHRNASVNIPVVIGEGRFGDCSGILDFDTFEAVGEVEDPPPSYWEVMNEGDRSVDEIAKEVEVE